MSETAPFRQSETLTQRLHEQSIHKQREMNDSSEDIDPDFEKMAVSQESTEEQGHLHKFYQQVIKPAFPEAVTDLKILSGITALEARVNHEIKDPRLFPEVLKVAEVRRGHELSSDEVLFRSKRKVRVRDSFAKYLNIDPQEVNPDDVPAIAFGGSGGGFRAMIGVLGYCEEMKKAGLWDCFTYVAGVSGSCWSLATYYTFGCASMQAVIEHCKKRFSPHHPLSGDAIRLMLSAPGGAISLLGPLIQKTRSGLSIVAMDLYSIFTTGWIFLDSVPSSYTRGATHVNVEGNRHPWPKFSSSRKYTDDASEPLPILTAIRHERPWKDWFDKEHPFKEVHAAGEHASTAPEAWFQWFEFTPYEVGCDELAAWVPTWAFGRPFKEGKSTMQLPERSLALLLGLATSAPAGPLNSYLSTISRNLPIGFLGNTVHRLASAVSKLWGKDGTEEFENHHPLHACNEHNFLYHYSPVEPGQARPPGLENSPRIHLIDSGMDNNLPTYVLLHPKREVDVIISMDASSDVQKDTFHERVDQIGSRRGLKFTKRHDVNSGEDKKVEDRFKGLYGQIYDGIPCERPASVIDAYGRKVKNPPAPICERECTMIYLPMLPNDRAVPGFDPSTASFSGSYNLVWTADQVEMLVRVCAANFQEGQSAIKISLREAWQRKRQQRLQQESNKA